MPLSRRVRQRRDDWTVHPQLRAAAPMMTTPDLTCPACGLTMPEPAARVGAIAVCPACGGSFVIEADGTTRRATGADTTALSADDLKTLRTARGRRPR